MKVIQKENEQLVDFSTSLREPDDSSNDGSSEDRTNSQDNCQNTKAVPPDESLGDNSSKKETHVVPLQSSTQQKKPALNCTFVIRRSGENVAKSCLGGVNE